MYDVIVIGAGPTGSSAAKELASNRYSVLLLEKFRMPRNKSCSGVLIKKSMDLVEQYFGEEHSIIGWHKNQLKLVQSFVPKRWQCLVSSIRMV